MKKFFIILVTVLIIIQFIRPARNISQETSPNHIAAQHPVPADVKPILDRACNDCHTNNTYYPWYSNIQPVGWWLQYHVNDGKEHLNFSEFLSYDAKKQDHKMEELIEMVKEKEMPLNSYTWTHTEARLTAEERQLLVNWAEGIRKNIGLAR